MPPERVVRLRLRSVLAVIGMVLAVWGLFHVVSIARQVISWILIALFVALALNPAVEWFQRRGIRRRGIAVAIVYVGVLLVIAGVAYLFVPTLIDQINAFVKAIPGYIHDLTKGKGKLGFLETKYHIVEKVKEAIKKGGVARILGLSGAAISITKSVITIVVATVTILFLTLFMLLEGP